MSCDEAHVRELLDHVDDGVYFVDRKRRITFWSRGAERLTGYSREEAEGRRCHDNMLRHVDDEGRAMCFGHCPLTATMSDGELREGRVYLHHKSGHRVPVRVRATPMRDDAGKIIGGIEFFSDATPQKDLAERLASLEKMAMLDALTELPNRRFLKTTMDKRHGELQRYGWPYGLLILDIDHFKAFNDTHGHDVGDKVLRAVAKNLAHSARVFDVVGRWGGEEFLVVLANVDRAGMKVVAERMRMVVATSSVDIEESGKSLSVTISIGGALGQEGRDVAETLKEADQRLYEAKDRGRNRAILVAPHTIDETTEGVTEAAS